MFFSLSSYTVGSYEAYWKDVLVLQEVAEAVASKVNEGMGTQGVDANALAEVLKETVLPPSPDGGSAQSAGGGASAEGSSQSSLSALRDLNTDVVGVAARQLTDTLLRPVDAEQMAASVSESEQKGVSSLSVAMAVAVVESLGATAKSAAATGQPEAAAAGAVEAGAATPAPSAEAAQSKAITQLQGATSVAWDAVSNAAASNDVEATAQSAEHADTMSKALGLLASGVVQAKVNEQDASAILATAVERPPMEAPPAPTAIQKSLMAASLLSTAPISLPLWQAPLVAPQESAPKESDPPPAAPIKHFIWVVKQVLAWRWREHTVTVVKENASAHQALDDKKQQDKEHSLEDRRYLKHLELQALAQKAAWERVEGITGQAPHSTGP